jgi:hypothetical protein
MANKKISDLGSASADKAQVLVVDQGSSTFQVTVESVVDLANTNSVPTTATSTGTKGQIAFDSTHMYICYATDNWKRIAYASSFESAW